MLEIYGRNQFAVPKRALTVSSCLGIALARMQWLSKQDGAVLTEPGQHTYLSSQTFCDYYPRKKAAIKSIQAEA